MRCLNSNLLTVLYLTHLSCFHVLLVPVSAKVFISIDCGSSSVEPYTDVNSIEWVGDDQYIQTGKSRNINMSFWDDRPSSPFRFAESLPRRMTTVREFPTRKKNCYSIDVNNEKSENNTRVERVLVRASFLYGNYDNKSNPPTFQLQFNGNIWGGLVITEMDYITTKEVVYSLNHGNTITVCLAQTQPDNVPFISSLEVRSLNSNMYSYVDSKYPLYFIERRVYGTTTQVRYPEDSYDRIWRSRKRPETNNMYTWVNNESPVVKVNTISDEIPEALFRKALTSLDPSGEIWSYGGITNVSVLHFNAYFSEVIPLNSTQKRSFDIVSTSSTDTVTTLINVYDNVIPPYGHALQVRLENVTTNSIPGGNIWEIRLVPKKDSTLPPLISALEGYVIGDKLVQGTNSKDVKSLALLQKSFIQLQEWQGDPCLPSPYTWDWVACDSDTDSPRITALYLNSLGLVGTLPDFSDMDALETIDLHDNSLTQEIPKFLGTFPELKVLNLADNKFSGAIPSSLLKNKNLKLYVTGNPDLSTIPSSSNNKNSLTSTIRIIILGSVVDRVAPNLTQAKNLR